MEAKGVLIDSSIIIDFFRKQNKSRTHLYTLFNTCNHLFISILTHYELLCGATSPELAKDVKQLLDLFLILEFGIRESECAAEIYRELRRQNKLINVLDILIAATSIELDLPLASLNVQHFSRIQGLKMFPLT